MPRTTPLCVSLTDPESMGETPMPHGSMGETPMPHGSMGETPMPYGKSMGETPMRLTGKMPVLLETDDGG
ncbi:MAG: hypothetical protein ABFD92_18750 [Planctomycetaceae bacterium]|nr:hypothetical protein [Planctomycetaceae bacterium]